MAFFKATLVFGACFGVRVPPLVSSWFSEKFGFPKVHTAHLSSKLLKFGSKKLLGQDLAQKGLLPRFPDANFNSQLANPNYPNLAPKGSVARICPRKAFSQGSQKQLSIASWQAQIAQIWLQKAPWPGFFPEMLFPKVPRSKC